MDIYDGSDDLDLAALLKLVGSLDWHARRWLKPATPRSQGRPAHG